MGYIENMLKRFKQNKSQILWGIVLLGIFLSVFIPYMWIASVISVIFMSDNDLKD